MPPKPLVQSESQRAWVIALTMLGLLLVALLLAYPLCGYRRQTVGDMEIFVPARWNRVQQTQLPDYFGELAYFRHPGHSANLLAVATLHFDQPITLNTALHVAAAALVDERLRALSQPIHAQPFRVGALTGLRYTQIAANPLEPDLSRLSLLAVLTDGQRYWVICQTQLGLSEAMFFGNRLRAADTALFDAVCASVKVSSTPVTTTPGLTI